MQSEYHSYLNTFTNLGESAITGSIAVAGFLYLVMWLRFREAFALLLAFGVTGVLVTLLKLWFFANPYHQGSVEILSPSGHAALSIASYGMIGALISRRHGRWWLMVFFVGFLTVMAASRYTLGYHSLAEVLIGVGVSLIVCAAIYFLLLRAPAARFSSIGLVLVALAAGWVTQDIRIPTERTLQAFSKRISFTAEEGLVILPPDPPAKCSGKGKPCR